MSWLLRKVDLLGLLGDVEGKAIETGLQIESDAFVGVLCDHDLMKKGWMEVQTEDEDLPDKRLPALAP
jgi:hypothetical protein